MPTTTTMVGGLRIATAVVVVKNQMLTLKTHNIRYAAKVRGVFRDDKRHRIEAEYHSCSVYIPASIVICSCVLRCSNRNVW